MSWSKTLFLSGVILYCFDHVLTGIYFCLIGVMIEVFLLLAIWDHYQSVKDKDEQTS